PVSKWPSSRGSPWGRRRLGSGRRLPSCARRWRSNVKCEEVRQFLPDHVLGTLSETESAAVRRHLRACSSCRAESTELDGGVALFARAAHAAEPPPELRDRVMSVLEEEWAEVPARPPMARRRFVLGWQAVAAVLILVAGL